MTPEFEKRSYYDDYDEFDEFYYEYDIDQAEERFLDIRDGPGTQLNVGAF